MMRNVIMAVSIVALMIVLSASESRPIMADDSTPHLKVQRVVTLDQDAWKWNWSSWDQEKIITFGHFQHTVFWDADRVFVLARRDLRDDALCTLRLPELRLSSDDRHRNTCLGVSRKDGRLHLSWDHHDDPLRYAMSRAGFLTEPPIKLTVDDIEPTGPMLPDPSLEKRVTYPRFFTDSDGELFFFYRVGSSGNGNNYLHRYNADNGSWARLGKLFSSQGTYGPWRDNTSRCAYLHDLMFDRNDRLLATWVYRETGASWASNHDLHYAFSDDRGVTWQNNGGDKIADLARCDPIELADRGVIVREIPVYSWLMNAGCMAFDSENRPHVVTYQSRRIHRPDRLQHGPPAEVKSDLCFVHFWRSDDGAWHGSDPILPGPLGVSRVDMIFDSRDNLYFTYPTTEGFRYFVSSHSDQWSHWRGPQRLTGPEITGRDASKHDRARWEKEGVYSFTARVAPQGFAIVDALAADQ